MQLALSDSLLPLQNNMEQGINHALAGGAPEIAKMREQASKGYVRPVVLKLQTDSLRQGLLFVFALEPGDERASLSGFFVSTGKFVQQVLRPKISGFASQNFLLRRIWQRQRSNKKKPFGFCPT